MKIKAGPIANLSDARYFAAKEVEWLSFQFAQGTEDYIAPAKAAAMMEWTAGVQFIAQSSVFSLEETAALALHYQIPILGVDTFTTPKAILSLPPGLLIHKEIVVEHAVSVEALVRELELFNPLVGIVELNFEKSGLSWSDLKARDGRNGAIDAVSLKALCHARSLLLNLPCPLSELEEMLRELQPYGLTLKGGAEERPGLKSFDELDEAFDVVERFYENEQVDAD